MRGHKDSIFQSAVSSNGLRLASTSNVRTIRLWDVTTGQSWGEPIQCLGYFPAVSITFVPDSPGIAFAFEEGCIQLRNVDTGQGFRKPLRFGESSVCIISFSRDGSRLISSSCEGMVQLWGVEAYANSDHYAQETSDSGLKDELEGDPLGISIPGFTNCLLFPDGWVQSSGNYLFWVPPDSRYGLLSPHLLLTLPRTSPTRATHLDFTHFQCGPSWTNVRPPTNGLSPLQLLSLSLHL